MTKRTRTGARRVRADKITRRSKKGRKTAQPLQPPTQRALIPGRIRRPVGVAIEYTPELLENVRYRFEETDEPVSSIAADLGVHRNTFRLLTLRNGWKRLVPPRDLSSAAKLLAQAERLTETGPAQFEQRADRFGEERASGSAPSLEASLSLAQDDATLAAAEEGVVLDSPKIIERLHRAVLGELSAVETMRAELKREPQSPLDAERPARTLSNLTEILQKLQRLQCARSETGSDDDDMPVDIDEFRRELARRIDAFVASRTDARLDDASIPPALNATPE